jgi:Intracellular proteinase inhibitor
MRTFRPITSRLRIAALGAACLAFLACGSDTSTAPTQDDAARAVNVFTQLADSVSRAGGDADVGSAYASLAEAVRVGGRISSIVITVDDVPTTFSATALQTEIDVSPCASPLCAAASRHVTLRTLIAWQQSNPRRLVQLSSEADADPIRAYLFPMLVPFTGNSASLTFLDGSGGVYFGTSGAQKFDVTKSAVPCTPATPNVPTIAIFPAPPRCTQADFAITFNAKAEPSSFLAAKNNATGSHTFAMPAQPVLGARFELVAMVPPLPPIVVMPNASLPATLTAKVDSLVTLTLSVSNPTSAPVIVDFNSGQHYDFTISDATNGALPWRWGMGMMFTQALGTETIPANGKLIYTAEWKPSQKGNFIATGSLVSQSHRADAKVAVSVP